MNTKASVIIPTYNRIDSLRILLDTLEQQDRVDGGFEVVIVDDGSTDETTQLANEQFGFPLHYYAQQNQGGFVARNRGAQYAQGETLIFLDDDISLEPGFVAGLVQEHESHERIVALGTFLPYLTPEDTPFKRLYAHHTATPKTQRGDFVSFTECVSNAFAVRREDFFRIGMMRDVVGKGPGLWGDVDLGYRAHLQGFRFRRCAVATCYHRDYTITDLGTYCRRMEQISELVVLLFHTYPEMEPHLPMFRDMAPVSWGVDTPMLTLRKLLRAAVSQKPVVVLMEQLAHQLEKHFPVSGLLVPLYRWIVGGYIWKGYRRGLRSSGLQVLADSVA
ncbi:MAG: glycosyltransferase family 2 protein [Chloroflexota bacterium]|nr:glycosyltransferase family 2 protein [Chloroflexota bacterium]